MRPIATDVARVVCVTVSLLVTTVILLDLGFCVSRNPVQPLWGIRCEQYYRTLSNILNL